MEENIATYLQFNIFQVTITFQDAENITYPTMTYDELETAQCREDQYKGRVDFIRGGTSYCLKEDQKIILKGNYASKIAYFVAGRVSYCT